MQIIITGGGGFLGQRLARALLEGKLQFDELVLADVVVPAAPGDDERVRCVQIDLTADDAAKSLISARTGMVFHLAAVVSSHAEKDFDLGWRVNLDATRHLLEACRQAKPGIRFVFASSLAVYGGKLPALVDDLTAVMPRSSYGAQKAMGELLVNDYARKQFVDGRVMRLPTVCVRPGRPNLAASSFVSGIIREPINGEAAVCPVAAELALWLTSPATVIQNLIHAATLEAAAFEDWRTVNLPGIEVTVEQMLESLERLTDAATRARVQFKPDAAIHAIVSTWPSALDNSRARRMGFAVDGHFDEFVRQFLQSV